MIAFIKDLDRVELIAMISIVLILIACVLVPILVFTSGGVAPVGTGVDYVPVCYPVTIGQVTYIQCI